MIDRFIFGAGLLVSGFVFNFAETWYFGWNPIAKSTPEILCDYVASAMMLAGLLIIASCFVEVR